MGLGGLKITFKPRASRAMSDDTDDTDDMDEGEEIASDEVTDAQIDAAEALLGALEDKDAEALVRAFRELKALCDLGYSEDEG